MSKLDMSRYYCCQYTYSENRICCFLNQRYKPMINILIKLINETPKSLEVDSLAVFRLLLKRPQHCLLKAIIEIIGRLSELKDFRKFLSTYKGFYVLCNNAVNYQNDIKLSCLNLGRTILSIDPLYSYNEIHSGISILFSSFPRSRAPSRAYSVRKESRKRGKSADVLKCNKELHTSEAKIPISNTINMIYEYLVDWISTLDKNLQIPTPFTWMILLTKKTGNESLLIKTINQLTHKEINIKTLLEVKGIINWLLKLEDGMYFTTLPLSLYKKIIDLHIKLLLEASKDQVHGLTIFRKHLEYMQKKRGCEINSFLWDKVITNMDSITFVLQFVFEFTFGFLHPIDSKTYKDFLYGLPIRYNSTLSLALFRFIDRYCTLFIKYFSSPSSLRDDFKIRSLSLTRQLKPTSMPSIHQRDIMPLNCIFVLYSILIHQTKDIKLLKECLSLIGSLIDYSLILLEFAKYKKEDSCFKQIINGFIFFISFLTNNLPKSALFEESLIQIVKKIMSYAAIPQSGSLDICNEIFLIETKAKIDMVYKEEKNESYLNKLKSKFPKFLAFNESIKDIGAYIKQALSKCTPPSQKSKFEYLTLKKGVVKKGLLFDKENRMVVKKLLVFVEIQRRSCESKWNKLTKASKRWQGLWRDKELFDNPSSKLPIKVSKHSFSNGIRCLTEIRGYSCKYLSNTKLEIYADQFVEDKTSLTLLNYVSPISIYKSRLPLRAFNVNSIIATLRKSIIPLIEALDDKSKEGLSMDCEIIEFLLTKPGKIYLTVREEELYLRFIYGPMCFMNDKTNDSRKTLIYTHPYNKKFTKKYNLRELDKIYKKQIIDAGTAIEFFFSNGKTLLLNFTNEDRRDTFCTRLLKSLKRVYKDKFIPVFEGKKSIDKMDLTQSWINNSISNFEYLLALNQLSSRSFNNSSQYPVFPWILNDYGNTLDLKSRQIYRNFSKCVGMMGDPARAELFKEKFDQTDISGLGRCNYGSHYSSPGIVLQFMMRLFPFFEGYIDFFNGLDNPNRMFCSIGDTFNSVWTDSNDLRELIPEFYCVPEMFLNQFDKPFGIREEDQKAINDVIIPKWANCDARAFVLLQRQMLESENVSMNIQKWIDLIFGYQQRGKEAEKVFNVFPVITTEPAKALAECLPEHREDYRFQAYQWGQTPQQLFFKSHPQKDSMNTDRKICDKNVVIKSFTYKGIIKKEIEANKKNAAIKADEKIHYIALKIKEDLQNGIRFIILTAEGDIYENITEYLKTPEQGYNFILKCQPPKTNSYADLSQYKVISNINPPVLIINKEKNEHIAQAGYLDGSIRLISLLSLSNSVVLDTYSEVITALRIDSSEVFVVAGSIRGNCMIYNVNEGLSWSLMGCLLDHKKKVNSIWISDEMQLFATVSDDGTANLYTKSYSPKLLRTLHHPSHLKLDHVTL